MKMKRLIIGMMFCLVSCVAFSIEGEAVNVYRLYNKNNGDHVYTSSQAEYNAAGRAGWTKENSAWDSGGNTRVYRLYNPNSGLHHFTINGNEAKHLNGLGWRSEDNNFTVQGISNGTYKTPTQKLYNRNSGAHLITKSVPEVNQLKNAGWTVESKIYFFVK